MISTRFVRLFVFGAVWVAFTPRVTAQIATSAPLAGTDLPAIRDAIAATRDRVKTLEIETLLPAGRGGQVTRHRVFASGQLRYAALTHFSDRAPESLDILENHVYYTGDSLNVYFPRNQVYEVSEKSANLPYAWKVRGPFALECLGWWPSGDTTKPPAKEQPFFLHEALVHPGYHVRSARERIGDCWCVVVERPYVDRLWFEIEGGPVLRRREWLTGDPPALSAVYELDNYRSVGSDVRFPGRIRRVFHARPVGDVTRPGRVESDLTASVVRVEVNTLTPAHFRFTPPPGTLVQDLDAQTVTQIPGGHEFLESVVQLAEDRGRLPSSGHIRRIYPLTDPVPTTRDYVLIVATGLLGILDILLLVRWFSRLLRRTRPVTPKAVARAPV
jgi:hypothetical protein